MLVGIITITVGFIIGIIGAITNTTGAVMTGYALVLTGIITTVFQLIHRDLRDNGADLHLRTPVPFVPRKDAPIEDVNTVLHAYAKLRQIDAGERYELDRQFHFCSLCSGAHKVGDVCPVTNSTYIGKGDAC